MSGLSSKRLGVRKMKFLNFILKFNPNFISEVQNLNKKNWNVISIVLETITLAIPNK